MWTSGPLEKRSRGDLIEAYMITTGKESIQWERFFELASNKVIVIVNTTIYIAPSVASYF